MTSFQCDCHATAGAFNYAYGKGLGYVVKTPEPFNNLVETDANHNHIAIDINTEYEQPTSSQICSKVTQNAIEGGVKILAGVGAGFILDAVAKNVGHLTGNPYADSLVSTAAGVFSAIATQETLIPAAKKCFSGTKSCYASMFKKEREKAPLLKKEETPGNTNATPTTPVPQQQ